MTLLNVNFAPYPSAYYVPNIVVSNKEEFKI